MTKWRVKERKIAPSRYVFFQGGMVSRDWFSDTLKEGRCVSKREVGIYWHCFSFGVTSLFTALIVCIAK